MINAQVIQLVKCSDICKPVIRLFSRFVFRYAPVPVDRLDETPCQGVFLIHQGIQRRLAITLVHEFLDPIKSDRIDNQLNCSHTCLFQGIHEVVVGRVRENPEWLDSDEHTHILSLSLLPAQQIHETSSDR